MMECVNCGAAYPNELKHCPLCGKVSASMQGMQDALCFAECMTGTAIGYAVSYCRMDAPANIIIPSEHHGKPVLEIRGGAFRHNETILTVHIPNTILKIGDYAFENCVTLSNVSGCESLKLVGEGAFRGCIQLDPHCDLLKAHFSFWNNTFAGCYRLPVLDH